MAQTMGAWVCTVHDDSGENEKVRELIANLGDSRIGYVGNSPSNGMVANWNQCLDHCKTPLVTILHADDELTTDYARVMISLAEQFPLVTGFFCDAEIIDEHSNPTVSFVDIVKYFLKPKTGEYLVIGGDEGLARLAGGDFIMCPTVCYRMSTLSPLRFDDAWKFTVDWNFFVDILLSGRSLVGIREKCYRYRRHGDQATALLSKNAVRFEEEFKTVKQIRRKAETMGWPLTVRASRRHIATQIHLIAYLVVALIKLDLTYAGLLYKTLKANYQ
jgi:hypothetical protein